MNKDNQGNGMNTVRPHTEDEIYDLLKQALDAMRLHTAETHPLVETERAMEAVEAKLAQPAQKPVRREQQLFMDEQAFYAAGHQAMRPAELAERLKQGERWAVGQERQPLTTAGYIQALGPLLEHIECSLGTLHCIVRTIEALHGIKEQP